MVCNKPHLTESDPRMLIIKSCGGVVALVLWPLFLIFIVFWFIGRFPKFAFFIGALVAIAFLSST